MELTIESLRVKLAELIQQVLAAHVRFQLDLDQFHTRDSRPEPVSLVALSPADLNEVSQKEGIHRSEEVRDAIWEACKQRPGWQEVENLFRQLLSTVPGLAIGIMIHAVAKTPTELMVRDPQPHPWTLTDYDRKMLRSMRIAPDDQLKPTS